MAEPADAAAINIRLALMGLPLPTTAEGESTFQLVAPILARQREFKRRLDDRLCAADKRVQDFLDSYLADTGARPRIPRRTLVLDEPGLARALSLPLRGDKFVSPRVASYRLANGVLHNPSRDRRTTAGVFHIATGGLPIPDDKIAVDKSVFGRLLEMAVRPPREDLCLPYTCAEPQPAACMVSLLLRPLVAPAAPGRSAAKRMEIRFIAPGGLVSNLDFVESVFGNAGDPYLPENDASLDPEGWTGQTGLVVLAPHLVRARKRDLGLPGWQDADERARRDGQCWRDPGELYNDGQPFKVCARDERGVIVTVIADNYFGYCKKEVKTQISYAANLYGGVEEEHAGGAIVHPAYTLGQQYTDDNADPSHTLEDVLARDPSRFGPQPEGHALDSALPGVVLVPARSTFSLRDRSVSWDREGERRSIRLRADEAYVAPDGYVVRLRQSEADPTQWSLIGAAPGGTGCHKPATVSGGGKSEISKALSDAFIFGNAYVPDFDRDMEQVAKILGYSYANRFADPALNGRDTRKVLSESRSLGSVIKLLSPNPDYSEQFNRWLASIPQHIKELVYVVKRFYRPEWGEAWLAHFSVGMINGRKGNALRLDGQKIMVNMLRVGFDPDGSWRLFGLRNDFSPALKVQTEDDITASVVVPGEWAAPRPDGSRPETSRKLVENCERLLFQRPDDAIHRGYDRQAEADIASPDTFLTNFEPLTRAQAAEMAIDVVSLSAFTPPMRDLVSRVADPAEELPEYFVSSSDPRLVDGRPSRNPRYLQRRPDHVHADTATLLDLASHLRRRMPLSEPLAHEVDVVVAGRRNNPPEPGVPPLCAHNPLHHMPLPELFMEFVSSMTGKSPSTTGAGSEGAMTKGPFNALAPIIDLNAALLSFVLTGYDGWVSAAGHVGPRVRVDHDISLLVPEVFSRMTPAERDAANLIAEGALARVEDYEHDGQVVPASRLGYRMTEKFALKYFGRIFWHPHVVFTPEMLRPELQDPDVYAASVATIVETHARVAKAYFADGSIALAVPPLRALLEIMADGRSRDGHTLSSEEFRAQFERDNVLASEWYADRLAAQQVAEVALAERGLAAMREFASVEANAEAALRIGIPVRIAELEAKARKLATPAYRDRLVGALGRQVHWR